jgi:hypothetical protein
MRDQHDDLGFGKLAGVLLPEIQADDAKLRSIADKLGPGPSASKQAGGRPLETRAFKLGHTGDKLRDVRVVGNSLRSAYMANSACRKRFRWHPDWILAP